MFEKLNIRKENIKVVDGDDTKLANYYRNAELFVTPGPASYNIPSKIVEAPNYLFPDKFGK